MQTDSLVRNAGRCAAAGALLGAASWAAYAAKDWMTYGRTKRPAKEGSEALLDLFLPTYDVVECHRAQVEAPADFAFAAAVNLDPGSSPIIRAIFNAREWILGSEAVEMEPRDTLVEQCKAIGWTVLAEIPGREIVLGTVTKPWEPNPVFRSIAPGGFAAFAEPGYVKIAWTLRADQSGECTSVARTETRVATTDPVSRARFRRYWTSFAPGIRLIRRVMLHTVRNEAERRFHAAESVEPAAAAV